MLSYAPKGHTATVYSDDGDFQIVDLLLVTGLEVKIARSGGRRRGRST